MTEIWKKIPAHETYEVSNYGRVRDKFGNILSQHFTGEKSKQYLTVYLRPRSQQKVHRLVLKAFIGMPKENEVGCHRDDDTMNNKLENLYWGTQKENVADSIKRGTHRKFEKKNPYRFKPQISDEIIFNIKSEYTQGLITQKSLAEKYKVDASYISYLVNGKRRAA